MVAGEQRMNYFQLFELSQGFFPDPAIVRKKYYELSRKFHPDFFVQQGEVAREQAEEKLKEVHAAYTVLSDAGKTMAYLLELETGMIAEEKYALSPDFLMEMMELNEALQEAETAEARAEVTKSILDKKRELYENIKPMLEAYQPGIISPEAMLPIKEYYYRQKYIQRLLGQAE
ncbi:MAG: iron-sulfur cluster co-chaperone HscB C-terminal domain-containing protein [Sediminibacterium sp.]